VNNLTYCPIYKEENNTVNNLTYCPIYKEENNTVNNLTYCPIYKVASTSWGIALLKLRNEYNPKILNVRDLMDVVFKKVQHKTGPQNVVIVNLNIYLSTLRDSYRGTSFEVAGTETSENVGDEVER
ncbi:hypothetical protein Avbf_16156, partial [Armadillidium vulgare]